MSDRLSDDQKFKEAVEGKTPFKQIYSFLKQDKNDNESMKELNKVTLAMMKSMRLKFKQNSHHQNLTCFIEKQVCSQEEQTALQNDETKNRLNRSKTTLLKLNKKQDPRKQIIKQFLLQKTVENNKRKNIQVGKILALYNNYIQQKYPQTFKLFLIRYNIFGKFIRQMWAELGRSSSYFKLNGFCQIKLLQN